MDNRRFIATLFVVASVICSVRGRFVHQITDFDKPAPIAIQQCRLGCLSKFLNAPANLIAKSDDCSEVPNCFMCWDYCSMLYKEDKHVVAEMCTDSVCFNGCKFACSYYNYFMTKPLLHRLETMSIND